VWIWRGGGLLFVFFFFVFFLGGVWLGGGGFKVKVNDKKDILQADAWQVSVRHVNPHKS